MLIAREENHGGDRWRRKGRSSFAASIPRRQPSSPPASFAASLSRHQSSSPPAFFAASFLHRLSIACFPSAPRPRLPALGCLPSAAYPRLIALGRLPSAAACHRLRPVFGCCLPLAVACPRLLPTLAAARIRLRALGCAPSAAHPWLPADCSHPPLLPTLGCGLPSPLG